MNEAYLKKLFSLDGKKAIVTGASQGIGRAIADSLAAFGAEVVVLGRNKAYLKDVEDSIRAAGGVCKAYEVDVSCQAKMNAFFDEYMAENGRLDIFVNNAAYTVMKHATETTEDEMDGLFATNIKGALFGLSRAAEIMKKQRDGSITIVTSVNALAPLPPQAVYTSTKCALEGLMKCLAADLSEYGIRVNSCAPGAINTNMNAAAFSTQEGIDECARMIPLGRVGESPDIGDVVACMASDAFRYMTGSTVLVDGGVMLRKG